MEYITKFRYTSLEDRRVQSVNIRNGISGRTPAIPVIIDRVKVTDPLIVKHKYIVPTDMGVHQFLTFFRSRNIETVDSSQAIFVFTGDNTLVAPNMLMSQLYALHHDKSDGFLYLKYALESTFGYL